MPSTEQMTAVVDAYVAGFEEGDTEAIVALFAEAATVEDPVGTPLKVGTAQIREFYAAANGAKLELMGEPRCAGEFVAFPFKVKINWEGQSSAIEVIDTFRINDAGKITEMRAFWGPANMKSA